MGIGGGKLKPSYTYINTNKQIRRLIKWLGRTSLKEIAVDLEGEYNRHRYGIHLCLLQIYDGQKGYLIDPFRVHPKYLRQIFTNDLKKVMFAPGSDLMLIQNTLDCTIKNVIDLQLAARMIGLKKLSLSDVLKETVSIEIPKKKEFQCANWSLRPLKKPFLEYAFSDVAHLFDARDVLFKELKKKGKYRMFVQLNREYRYKDYTIDPAKRYLRIKNAKSLSRRGKIYLRYFFECRDKIAQREDVSPNNIMENATLIKISKCPPKKREQWEVLEGTGKSFESYVDVFMNIRSQVEEIIQNFTKRK